MNVLVGRNARLRDGVLGLWNLLTGRWGAEFPLEYLAEAGAESEPVLPGAPVWDRADIRYRVFRLARFLEEHGHGLLVGDPDAYRTMGRIGRRRSRELTEWASGKHEKSSR